MLDGHHAQTTKREIIHPPRDGNWKLIEWYEDGQLELFNLREDLEEKHNLAAANPARAKGLQAKLVVAISEPYPRRLKLQARIGHRPRS